MSRQSQLVGSDELRGPRRKQPSTNLGRPSYNFTKTVQELQNQQMSVQKRTFTRWMNAYLCKWRPPMEITNLFHDIKDGTKLLALLQLLSGQRLNGESGRKLKRVHYLSNIQMALRFLDSKKIRLVNINASDIVDGKPSIVLGLLWTIILYFQIEEITNNLSLTGELSGSTSSLDSCVGAEDGSPPQKQKKGAKAKWQGAAKKALLSWVKRKTKNKPAELDVAVRDFGPSWRDGRAFHSMIHTIDPELVDVDAIRRATNRENLATAFDTAYQHLGIPKLLDPEDVDVDRPDEKSIMTYVAQFVKQYGTAGEEGHETPQVDEDVIQYEDLMTWLTEAESTMSDVHKRHKYRQQDYLDQKAFKQELEHKRELIRALREKWLAGGAKTVDQDQIKAMEDLLLKINDSAKRWHRELDSRLPGQLGEVGAWIHKAEAAVSEAEYDDDVSDDDLIADAIKQQLEEHKAIFKDMNPMLQAFQRMRRAHRFSGHSIPLEQLEEMSNRFAALTTASTQRSAQLEYAETKHRLMAQLSNADKMLAEWTKRCGNREAVQDTLQNYIDNVEKRRVLDKLEYTSSKARQLGEAYLRSDETMSDIEREAVQKFLSDKDEQAKAICGEIVEARKQLENAAERWREYEESVEQFQPWLVKAESALAAPEEEKRKFFGDWKRMEEVFNVLTESGEYLAEVCEDQIAEDIDRHMDILASPAARVLQECEKLSKEEEIEKRRRDFELGIENLHEWLSNVEAGFNQSVPVDYSTIKGHIQDLEDVSEETTQVEEKFKDLSKIAQSLVKDTEAEDVNVMLKTMTDVKDRLLKARRTVSKLSTNFSDMLKPIQTVDVDVESLNDWLDDAERLLTSHSHPETDMESQFQAHQKFFAKTEQQQEKLSRMSQNFSKIQQLSTPGMAVADVQDKITESSARLQLCTQQAAEWKPKLKQGTEALRKYRASLGAMQRWMEKSQEVMVDGKDPKERLSVHQEFFSDLEQTPISSFLEASDQLRNVQTSQTERASIYDAKNQMQQQYQAVLKKASAKLMQLKYDEAADEFSAILDECKQQLASEESRLSSKSVAPEDLVDEHKNHFQEPLDRLCELLQNMEDLNQSMPSHGRQMEPVSSRREEYESLLAAEERTHSKLTQVPEKQKDFKATLGKVQDWVKNAEEIMGLIHKPLEADPVKFKGLRDRFSATTGGKDAHLDSLEWLSDTLKHLAKYLPEEEVGKDLESVLSWRASSLSIINAFDVTERRLAAAETCFKYQHDIEETKELIEAEMRNLEDFGKDVESQVVDNLDEANQQLAACQTAVNSLEPLSQRVASDVAAGKELHADEQVPSFLYNDVSNLEKQWNDLQQAASEKYDEIKSTVEAWEEHESLCAEVTDFITSSLPALDARLRLSNLNSINQELNGKFLLRKQLERAEEDFAAIESGCASLTSRSSEEGKKGVKSKNEEMEQGLTKVREKLESNISKLEGIKEDWLDCDKQLTEIGQWTQDVQMQISEIEQSDESAEVLFSRAQESSGAVRSKEQELLELEERCSSIEGLVSPTTLDAKLTTVRGKWKQAHARVEALVSSLGEHLSHQDKFDATQRQLDDFLENAETQLEAPLEACSSSDDVTDRKDAHLKFSHGLEQVRLGLTTLQSESKLLKDSRSANDVYKKLQNRYNDVIQKVKARSKLLDEALRAWQRYERDVGVVRQFIEKCEKIVSEASGALPGDQTKLVNELETADKLCNSVPAYQQSASALKDQVEDLSQFVETDSDLLLTKISAMECLLENLPQQFADRKRIVAAALGSHVMYADTVERFTGWLLAFEKSLRATTDVHLDDVTRAVTVIQIFFQAAMGKTVDHNLKKTNS